MNSTLDTVSLTQRQSEILAFVYNHARDFGFQPEIREIGIQFGIASPNGVMCHVRALVSKGYLGKRKTAARSLVMLRKPDGSKFDGFADKE